MDRVPFNTTNKTFVSATSVNQNTVYHVSLGLTEAQKWCSRPVLDALTIRSRWKAPAFLASTYAGFLATIKDQSSGVHAAGNSDGTLP